MGGAVGGKRAGGSSAGANGLEAALSWRLRAHTHAWVRQRGVGGSALTGVCMCVHGLGRDPLSMWGCP